MACKHHQCPLAFDLVERGPGRACRSLPCSTVVASQLRADRVGVLAHPATAAHAPMACALRELRPATTV